MNLIVDKRQVLGLHATNKNRIYDDDDDDVLSQLLQKSQISNSTPRLPSTPKTHSHLPLMYIFMQKYNDKIYKIFLKILKMQRKCRQQRQQQRTICANILMVIYMRLQKAGKATNSTAVLLLMLMLLHINIHEHFYVCMCVCLCGKERSFPSIDVGW